VDYYIFAGCTVAETKHVIGLVWEINKEHCIQIKIVDYSCTYLKCIFYFFNKLNKKIQFFLLLEKWGAWFI
jgi:hypothetical protein